MDPVRARRGALTEAKNGGFDVVIVDTAGRLHIDDELMEELQAIKAAVEPTDLLYVADAMTGQDAIKSAGEFNRRIGVTGVVLTQDGRRRARRRGAVGRVGVVGVPIAFVGSGERLQDLEPFHPDRVVSRVLGMGDVLSLIEKAEEAVSTRGRREARREDPARRLHARGFPRPAADDQEDGAARADPRHAPGHGQPEGAGAHASAVDEKQLGRVEAIINSMTPEERRNHQLINGSRRKRIARGSGTTVEEVNRLLKQFMQMQKMLKALGGMAGGGGGKGKRKRMGALRQMMNG